MDTPEELMSFLDLLDLDESMIDAPLKYLMGRSTFTKKHLKSAIQLLQYKILVNTQEDMDCENDDEYDFAVKLLMDINPDNIEYVCQIVDLVLSLNTCIIVSRAEHLIQQLMADIEDESETLLILKACYSILNAVEKSGDKMSLRFFDTPLQKVLDSVDEDVKNYFLTKMVPKFLDNVVGYRVLDGIWNYIENFYGDKKHNALKIINCLADYYLPGPDASRPDKYKIKIYKEFNFWDIMLFGTSSDDASIRKLTVYLSKRAIDCVMVMHENIHAEKDGYTLFDWKHNKSEVLKQMWDNYFVLIDSLEEKQANIVLPSLKLFSTIKIEECWLNAAFNIALRQDNIHIRLKSIEYKLKTNVKNELEACTLLEALNDINIYDQSLTSVSLTTQMIRLFKKQASFIEIFKATPLIKWSPVPLYNLTKLFADIRVLSIEDDIDILKITIEILKIPCNSVVLRKAIQVNMAYFVEGNCDNPNVKDIATMFSLISVDSFLHSNDNKNPFSSIVKKISLNNDEITNIFRSMTDNVGNINFMLFYLYNNREDMSLFINIINELQQCVNRQYSDKKQQLNNVIFLINFLNKIKNNANFSNIYDVIGKQSKTVLQYILSLFLCEGYLELEETKALMEDYDIEEGYLGDILLELYKTSVMFLMGKPELHNAVFSIYTYKMLQNHTWFKDNYRHEMLSLERFMDVIINFQFRDGQYDSVGRLQNTFYEKSCEILYLLVSENRIVNTCLDSLIQLIEKVLECGGYGCLKWILKIINSIVQPLVESEFNMTNLINRVWNEIEELKSNNQYSPCIEEFVELITQDALLEKAMYNNMIISYCNKIIEYGPIKANPLYYLVNKLKNKDLKVYGHLIYVLCEIVHYSPVPRRDQRILDNTTLEVLEDSKYKINRESVDIHFNYEIQFLSVAAITAVNDLETLRMITNFLTIRIHNTFKNKQRYHANSQLHKVLQSTLQHVLMRALKGGDLDSIFEWCLDFLVKLPHQTSVRLCFEWFIALYFYIRKLASEQMINILKMRNVPIVSQFYIVYWHLNHKINNNTYTDDEFNFIMEFLLSHTMGQLFNVRLTAQYFATVLHRLVNKPSKFDFTIDIIQKTLNECESDRNYNKLRNDYFANEFDIIANLTPYFVYYLLPKYCEVDSNEKSSVPFVKHVMRGIEETIARDDTESTIFNEWIGYKKEQRDLANFLISNYAEKRVSQCDEEMGTIQKKYIPWKNMTDINVYDVGKEKNQSNLIVVASLIDKLPNLGGMARTGEVFGVETYVVDSLRHLQDRQFQGLSVSAERWINIEEVRPGKPLKEYLMKKKEEGYTIIAAEQTSTSVKLQTFKFPKKTLLLLGNEKDGIPCDLLPFMNECVEIPQQGYVRSLNVHVTAAIFIWEYARQNNLMFNG